MDISTYSLSFSHAYQYICTLPWSLIVLSKCNPPPHQIARPHSRTAHPRNHTHSPHNSRNDKDKEINISKLRKMHTQKSLKKKRYMLIDVALCHLPQYAREWPRHDFPSRSSTPLHDAQQRLYIYICMRAPKRPTQNYHLSPFPSLR